MQLATDHPTVPTGAKDVRFFITAGIDGHDEDDEAEGGLDMDASQDPRVSFAADEPPEPEPADDDFATLFDEERRRTEILEQKLASAVLLLHETAAERDRWHSQAQRALTMIDSLQRQITTKPLRPAPPRRRFLGLF